MIITVSDYESAFRSMTFDSGTEGQIRSAANRVMGRMWNDYDCVERLRGIPAIMVGCIHALECNNDPIGTLHNGERIIGLGKRTTLAPAGRGPFRTWIGGAIDAVDSMPFWKVNSWTVGTMLMQCEKWNGLGYRKHYENSPYLWACTSVNDGFGKYVADGKFDPNAPVNVQVGVAAIMKCLADLGKIQLKYEATT